MIKHALGAIQPAIEPDRSIARRARLSDSRNLGHMHAARAEFVLIVSPHARTCTIIFATVQGKRQVGARQRYILSPTVRMRPDRTSPSLSLCSVWLRSEYA